MAEAMQHSSTDELATIPYEVIRDKTLNTHDHLFKLIIIGDSCKLTINSIYHLFLIYSQSSSLCLYLLAVGKSCLLSRVMDEEFKVEH